MQDNLFIKGSCNYKDYVLPDVKAIIDTGKYNGKNWTPTEIFDKYGGYVLVDGIFGGRLEYNVTANSDFCSSYSNFKANVKASYNAGFASVSGEVDHQTATNTSQFNSHSSTTVITYGGSAQDGKSVADKSGAALQKWRDSIPDRAVLVEFGPTGALIPIWELCSSPARANELRTAFAKYSENKQIKLPPPPLYVVDFAIGSSGGKGSSASKAKNQIGAGYTILDVDLNEGAGGYYIYLGYKLGTNVNDAYRDIFIADYTDGEKGNTTATMKHNGVTASYYRFRTDFNKGAGGKHWLHMWTSRNAAKPPIKQIEIIRSATEPKDGDGWTYVKWHDTYQPADCNRYVGGSRLYIRYR